MAHPPNPDLSVIIPVRNNPEGLKRCVRALERQTLPAERFEIIVVDNGSDDGTLEMAEQLPVRLFTQSHPRTPYAARNRGLKEARGRIIAFTDTHCIPDRAWLENGMKRLESEGADLLGGQVEFTFSERGSAAERFDSLVNLEMKENIARKGVAKTGNLFARRDLFSIVGPFREDVRSGGDVEWTGRATRTGFKIVFGPDVVVYYPARPLIPLLKKMYRVGKGQPEIWRRESLSGRQMLGRLLYDLRPMLPGFIRDQIVFREQKDVPNSMMALMAVGWSCRLATGAGRLVGLRQLQRGGKREGKQHLERDAKRQLHDDGQRHSQPSEPDRKGGGES